jgi:hypothetical protein
MYVSEWVIENTRVSVSESHYVSEWVNPVLFEVGAEANEKQQTFLYTGSAKKNVYTLTK